MADNEPVYAPDQLKPGNRRGARIGAILTAVILVAMLFPNKDITGVEMLWVVGTAAMLLLVLLVDSVLRRNGLR